MKGSSKTSPHEDRFGVNGFRPHRRWAVDSDYLRRLPPAEAKWMRNFLREYYDADNKLLRPEKHAAKCRACREGGDCGRRPPPQAIHATDALRRDCYRRQYYAEWDVQSRGLVSAWEDFDSIGVSEDGEPLPVTPRAGRFEAVRPRHEAGDYSDHGDGPPTVPGGGHHAPRPGPYAAKKR